jgi:hypothetical protein
MSPDLVVSRPGKDISPPLWDGWLMTGGRAAQSI